MSYVVVLGTEGVGKSTLLRNLKRIYPEAINFREPGGTPMTVPLREYLLNHFKEFSPLEQLVMFTADRVMLNIMALRPALEAKKLVLSDRSFLDTLTIQCDALEAIEPEWYLDLLRRLNFPFPELVLDLRLDPVIGSARRKGTAQQNDVDQLPPEFHQKVRAAMDRLPTLLPETRFVTIEASQSPDEVLTAAVAAITHHLG